MRTNYPQPNDIALPAEITAAVPGVRVMQINADLVAAIIDSTPRADVAMPARAAGPHLILSMILDGETSHIADGVDSPYTFTRDTCVLSCSWDAHRGTDYLTAYRRLHAISLKFRTDWLEMFAPLLLSERLKAQVFRHPHRRSYIVRLPMWTEVRNLAHKLLQIGPSLATADSLTFERYALSALWEVADRMDRASQESASETNDAWKSDRRSLTGRERRLLVEARLYIDEHYLEPVKVVAIAKAVGLGYSALKAGFPILFGKGVYEYVLECRIQHAAKLLAHSDLSIHEVANRCGFSHSSHMARRFRVRFGVSPRDYRTR